MVRETIFYFLKSYRVWRVYPTRKEPLATRVINVLMMCAYVCNIMLCMFFFYSYFFFFYHFFRSYWSAKGAVLGSL